MYSTKLRIVLRTAYLFCFVDWPCGWFFFFFCLDTKEEETRRKNQGYVSGATAERSFWC